MPGVTRRPVLLWIQIVIAVCVLASMTIALIRLL